MKTISGSCLCNSISFVCDNHFQQFHLCHCIQCQKVTGSAHASNLFTATDNITWNKGLELVARYDIPGRTISNAFCKNCGSAVPYVSASGKALVVPAGCLDGQPDIRPQDNIFWEERASWYEDALNASHVDGFPE